MAITNTLSRGDKVLVLESGRFAVAWGEMAAFSGVEVEVLEAPDRGPVDPAAVEARLRADTARSITAVFVVQVDTGIVGAQRHRRDPPGASTPPTTRRC